MQLSVPAWGGLAGAGAPVPLPTRTSVAVLASLGSVLLFMLLNPFLALFLLALFSLFQRVPAMSFIAPASVSFAYFFFSRDYGIDWYANGSTDDVPQYISLYNSDYGLGFTDLFSRFFESPSGNEPLWHLPWWVLTNAFNGSDSTFVFLHYLLIFLALFLALCALSSRQLIPFTLVYLLLIPISIDGIAHIWRQELASFLFLAGVGLSVVRGNRAGKWLILVSPLVHLSALFFVGAFLAFELLRRRHAFDNRLKVSVFLVIILLTIPALTSVAVRVLDTIGLSRIVGYFEGYGVDQVRVYLLIGAYAAPQLIAFWLLRTDDVNRFVLVLCFAVFSIVLALPAANGIYDRLLMFTLPLLALYFYRMLMANFAVGWRIPAMFVVFAIGLVRLHAPTAEGYGPGSYLAFGNAFDPTMGLLKMLTTF